MLVFKITINSLWGSNNSAFGVVLCEVFSKKASVGVGVVATNDNDTIQVKGFAVLEGVFKLLRRLNLVSSRANHVEASHVSVKLHVVGLDLHVVVAEDAVRSVEESKQLRVRVDLLSHIKETHDHIVSSCGLSS